MSDKIFSSPFLHVENASEKKLSVNLLISVFQIGEIIIFHEQKGRSRISERKITIGQSADQDKSKKTTPAKTNAKSDDATNKAKARSWSPRIKLGDKKKPKSKKAKGSQSKIQGKGKSKAQAKAKVVKKVKAKGKSGDVKIAAKEIPAVKKASSEESPSHANVVKIKVQMKVPKVRIKPTFAKSPMKSGALKVQVKPVTPKVQQKPASPKSLTPESPQVQIKPILPKPKVQIKPVSPKAQVRIVSPKIPMRQGPLKTQRKPASPKAQIRPASPRQGKARKVVKLATKTREKKIRLTAAASKGNGPKKIKQAKTKGKVDVHQRVGARRGRSPTKEPLSPEAERILDEMKARAGDLTKMYYMVNQGFLKCILCGHLYMDDGRPAAIVRHLYAKHENVIKGNHPEFSRVQKV